MPRTYNWYVQKRTNIHIIHALAPSVPVANMRELEFIAVSTRIKNQMTNSQ